VRLTTFITLAFALAADAAGATDDSPIARIAAYQGTWTTTIVHYKTAYSRARTETSRVRNDCWRSAEYYTCHQFVNGASAALIVYTYDPKVALYHTHVVVGGAAPAPAGDLQIAGATWTYPWRDRDEHGRQLDVRIVNTFRSPRTIEFRQEVSTDHVHWTRTADGTEHRSD